MSEEDDVEKELLERLKNSDSTELTEDILNSLSAEEAIILRKRFGKDLENIASLEEIGTRYDVTRERIREIEKKALKKLRGGNPEDDGPDAA